MLIYHSLSVVIVSIFKLVLHCLTNCSSYSHNCDGKQNHMLVAFSTMTLELRLKISMFEENELSNLMVSRSTTVSYMARYRN